MESRGEEGFHREADLWTACVQRAIENGFQQERGKGGKCLFQKNRRQAGTGSLVQVRDAYLSQVAYSEVHISLDKTQANKLHNTPVCEVT